MFVELYGVVKSVRDTSPAWHERAWHRIEKRQLDGVAGSVLHPEDMLTLPPAMSDLVSLPLPGAGSSTTFATGWPGISTGC